MPVTHITGNALDFPENTNVLAHGCNTLGSFGAGVALQIAQEYPAAAEADKAAFDARENQLGTFSSAVVAGGAKRIANLYIQESVGTDRRRVDYEALYSALSNLRAVLENAGKEGRAYRVAMPWIGCGLAGGSKTVVRAMIEDIFGESPIEVFVVEYIPKTSEKPVETAASAAPVTPADSSQIS